jgi:hypothetical protein
MCAHTHSTEVLTHPERAGFFIANGLEPIVPDVFQGKWLQKNVWEFLLAEQGFVPEKPDFLPKITSPPPTEGRINPHETKEICQKYGVPPPTNFTPQRLENSMLPPYVNNGISLLHADFRTYPGLAEPVNGIKKVHTDLNYLRTNSPPPDHLYRFGVYRTSSLFGRPRP